MRFSASLLLVVPAVLTAQDRPAPALEARVRALLAAQWDVAPDDVHLEWGAHRLHDAAPDAAVRLVGRGSGGWYAVVLDEETRSAAAQVRAGQWQPIAVAARPLASGSVLGEGDYRFERRIVWGASESESAAPSLGWLVRRPLAEGEALRAPGVAPPLAVESGRPVQLVWHRGPVAVALDGVAMHAARLGERLRVRVAGRPNPLTGVVQAPGIVALVP